MGRFPEGLCLSFLIVDFHLNQHAQGARPLDLHRPSNWQVQQSPSKRHRPQSRLLARGLKSLIDSPSATHTQEHSTTLYGNTVSPSSSLAPSNRIHGSHSPGRLSPNRRETDESSWDVVEDLPLRWATDFVPLATAGSRLVNTSVLSYALWSDENRKGRGGRLLAIATKNNILLYETPKGERAFHFVKVCHLNQQCRAVLTNNDILGVLYSATTTQRNFFPTICARC